jgi:predicted metal-binding membrane protein
MADRAVAVQRHSGVMTMAVAAACWPVAIAQMRGMDMGAATTLGPFAFFLGAWAAMMAAMMLPGAVPAVVACARTTHRYAAVGGFVLAYILIWTLVGAASYVVYRPHGTVAVGVVAIAAALYELTPVKRQARRRCRQPAASGFRFGVHCVGSGIGLMALLLAVGAMSVVWMSVVAALMVMQKLVPPHRTVDLLLAFALLGLGVLVLTEPSVVPGLMPPPM